jgi:hypothetical protein
MCLTPLGGTIDFGVIDPAKFTGSLSFLPLLPSTAKSGIYYSVPSHVLHQFFSSYFQLLFLIFLQVLMSSSFAGNSAIGGTNKEVVFDSGSTLLIMTTDWFASFKSIVLASTFSVFSSFYFTQGHLRCFVCNSFFVRLFLRFSGFHQRHTTV